MKIIETSVGPMYVRNNWDEAVIKEVIENHEYERWGEITINPYDTVIDCGSHIGSFTRLALSYGAKVLAIEPDEENFEVLLKNTEKSVNLKILKAVLWNGQNTNFVKFADRGELSKISPKGELRQTISLNKVVKAFNLKQIDLLKMDIEGSEYEVLYHFKYFHKVKQITMEWHYGASKFAKLLIFLEKYGFKTVWLGGNGDWGKLQMKHL